MRKIRHFSLLLIAMFILLVKGVNAQAILQESFEGTFPPSGWTMVNNGAGNNWKQNTTNTYSYHGTNSMFYGYSVTEAADAWAFTPSLALNTNPVTITFYVRVRSTVYAENLKVTIGKDTVPANHTDILLDSTGLKNITYNKWSVTYTPTSADNYIFGFNCYSDPNMWNLYVDSVTVWQQLPGCTGKPATATVVGPSGICSGTNFGLSASGATLANGIVYQWQSSSNGGTTWSNISGATSPAYSTSITAPTQYRFKTYCTNSSDSSTSNSFSVAINPSAYCLCSPATGVTLHTFTGPTIESVEISGTTLVNSSPGAPADGYTLFPATGSTTATLVQANTYDLVTEFLGTGTGTTIASVWVDWNQNGTYEASEWTQITTASIGSFTTSITVPANAKVGLTSLRIRTRASGSPNGSGDACAQFGSGETEEYIINVASGAACTGKPTAGVVTGPKSICPNTTFTLKDSASTAATGITYQWQVSTNGGTTWSNIAGATDLLYTTAITATSQYRTKVVCTASNDSAYTTAYTVAISPLTACYCSPNTGVILHSSTAPTIDTVSITGTTLYNINAGVPTNGYTSFKDSGNTTATLTQALTYNLITSITGTAVASLWIDWDQNGKFDSSEWKQIILSGTGAITTSISVPANAKLGKTGLRIRTRASGSSNGIGDACTTFGSGETEDYVITIAAGASCTGKPSAGVVTSGPKTICPNTAFSLKDSGSTAAIGITYQWQVSTNGGASWSDIAGANSVLLTTAITTNSQFRTKVVCTSSKDSAYTAAYTVSLSPVTACYCSPTTGVILHSSTAPTIDTVSITGTTLYNINKGAPTNGYTSFKDSGNLTATLAQALTYNLITNITGTAVASLWIDWDQNGKFDSSEWKQIVLSGTGSITTSISVPANAKLGKTGLRIRTRASGSSNGIGDACTTFGSGETEDYVITIAAGTPCTGKPNAGYIIAPSTTCPATNFTLKDTLYTAASAISYQWQSSTDGGTTWNSITGANNFTHTTSISAETQFRFKVVCTASKDSSYSNPVTVALKAIADCFCTPDNGTVLHTSTTPSIDSVAIVGTTLDNNDIGAPVNGYTMFPDNTNTTATLAPGTNYDLKTVFSGTTIASVWFDWNQNGNFEASEWTQITTTSSGLVTTSIPVPTTAKLGTSVMRIRSRSVGSPNAAANACTTFGSGETEDYILTIGVVTPVSVTAFKGEHKGTANLLSWRTLNELNNRGFSVERSLDGRTFTTIGFVKSTAKQGNSSETLSYQFVDEKPFNKGFYRLKQIDVDGRFAYSPIITLKASSALELSLLSVYPNPAKNVINLVVAGASSNKVNIIITDLAGKVVKQQTAQLSSEDNIVKMDVASLVSGNYLVRIVTNNASAVHKFFKQ